jgi:hypothetical protein
MVSGLGEIQARQVENATSLGTVQDVEILDVESTPVPKDQHDQWRARYDAMISQQDMWLPDQKPVPLPKYKPHRNTPAKYWTGRSSSWPSTTSTTETRRCGRPSARSYLRERKPPT